MIFDFLCSFCRLVETKSLGAVLIITCSGLIRVENNCIEEGCSLSLLAISDIYEHSLLRH